MLHQQVQGPVLGKRMSRGPVNHACSGIECWVPEAKINNKKKKRYVSYSLSLFPLLTLLTSLRQTIQFHDERSVDTRTRNDSHLDSKTYTR